MVCLSKALLEQLAADCEGIESGKQIYLQFLQRAMHMDINLPGVSENLVRYTNVLDAFFNDCPKTEPRFFSALSPQDLFRLQMYVLPQNSVLILLATPMPIGSGGSSIHLNNTFVIFDGRAFRGHLTNDRPTKYFIYLASPSRRQRWSTKISQATEALVSAVITGKLHAGTNVQTGRLTRFSSVGRAFAHFSTLALSDSQLAISSIIDLIAESSQFVSRLSFPVVVYVVRGVRLRKRRADLEKEENLDLQCMGALWSSDQQIDPEKAKCMLLVPCDFNAVGVLSISRQHENRLIMDYVERTLVTRASSVQRSLTRKDLEPCFLEGYRAKRQQNYETAISLQIVRLEEEIRGVQQFLSAEQRFESVNVCAGCHNGGLHSGVCNERRKLVELEGLLEKSQERLAMSQATRRVVVEEEDIEQKEDENPHDPANPCRCYLCKESYLSLGSDISTRGTCKKIGLQLDIFELLQLLGKNDSQTREMVLAAAKLSLASFDIESSTTYEQDSSMAGISLTSAPSGRSAMAGSQQTQFIGYGDRLSTPGPHYAIFERQDDDKDDELQLFGRFYAHIIARQKVLEKEKRAICAPLWDYINSLKNVHMEFYQRYPSFNKDGAPESTWKHSFPGLLEQELNTISKQLVICGFNAKR